MISFADWAAALSRSVPWPPPPAELFQYRSESKVDPRLEPVKGDHIDELVNEQLARGKADRR